METNIRIFDNPKFGEIRVTVDKNGEPMFCLSDICRVLEIKNTSRCKSRLKQDGISLMKGVSITKNQYGKETEQLVTLTYINENNLYRVIMRSDKEQAEAFQDWVCEEVLPSIRKTGGYMIAAPEETNEELLARAILVANDAIKRRDEKIKKLEQDNKEAEEIIKELRPKAELMEKVLDMGEQVDIGQATKILELPFGRNRLFKKLRENGIFFKDRNEPKQKYIEQKLFVVKEKLIKCSGYNSFTVLKVLVTQKGLEFLANLFKKEINNK